MSSIAAMAEDDWSFFNLVVGNLVTNFANPEHARDLATIFQRSTSPQTYLAYLNVLQKIDLTSLLPQIEAPSLVVHDTGFPFGAFKDCEELASAMRHARLQIIPGDGEAELAAIDSFLRSTAGAANRPSPKADANSLQAHLTPREIQVLRQIAQGKTNREISGVLVLSERTVSRHITNIYEKLGLRSKAEATAYAIHRGLA